MEKYTDQEFFYKQTPVNYDGIAKFTSIKGNTLVWNQLVKNGNFANGTTDWYGADATISASNGVCRVTFTGSAWNNDLRQTLNIMSGHKYLFSCDYKMSSNFGFCHFAVYDSNAFSLNLLNSTTKTHFTSIFTAQSSTNTVRFTTHGDVSAYSGEYYEVSNVYLIDLTQMGLDSLTVDEFKSLFPLPYYDFNQGTLIPFNGNGIKTVGKNLCTRTNQNSNIYNAGNLIQVKQGQTIYWGGVWTYTSSGGKFWPAVYSDPNETNKNNYISYGGSDPSGVVNSYTAQKDGYLGLAYGDGVSSYDIEKMMISFAPFTLDEYEPYTSTTTDLPISKYFPTGMKRAGNVYDELTESKAITRVGSRAYQSGDENNANYVTDGTTTYYPLATETETDAEDIFYKFYADGTEQLLPVNGSSPTTSYLIADIEYYDSTEGDSLYRRFWLINGDGERWDLTDKEFKSFLNNPTGLGFRKTIEVTRYGEKANKNNEVYDFPQPSGELLFYDTYNSTRYDKYNKFIRFLMSQPITLYYMIPVSYISGIANIFTLNCDVTEVQKTESKTDRILTSSIVFNGLGFYEGDEISVNGTTGTYTLTNEGDFPVGFEITVEGSLTKPYITLSQDGELYGEAKFVGTQAFNSLYVNSNDGEQNIILQQGGSVIPNPLSYQDLSISNGSIYVTFVKLAKGVSELSIGVESGSITNVNIKYSPKYRSV